LDVGVFGGKLKAGKGIGTPKGIPVALLIEPAVDGNAPDFAFRLEFPECER
jgi:hypothetical protein